MKKSYFMSLCLTLLFSSVANISFAEEGSMKEIQGKAVCEYDLPQFKYYYYFDSETNEVKFGSKFFFS